MKILFACQNNNSNQPPKIVFGAGLTRVLEKEILNTDVLEISDRLAQKGIPTDFNGNPVIAWGSAKTIELFERLNKNYKLKLALPKGIYAKDFRELNTDEPEAMGICNFFDTELIKGSKTRIPGQTVFFNTFETAINNTPPEHRWLLNWLNINRISDYLYQTKHLSTDHFLGVFIHEFTHNSHESNAFDKLGNWDMVLEKFRTVKESENIEEFKRKYGQKISQICEYALTNPLEAVACDFSKVVADSLDPQTLLPTRNPFIGTPYENLSFWQMVKIPNCSDDERPLQEILRRFWNGKFD